MADEYTELLRQQLKAQEDELNAQKQAELERREELKQMLGPRLKDASSSVDLSALASLADQMTGGNISQGVARQYAGSQAFQNRTDELLDQLNQLKGVKPRNVPLSLFKPIQQLEEGKSGRQMFGAKQSAFKDVAQQTQKLSDNIVDAGTNAQKMRAAFMTKDPRQVMPAMNELARTIQDVKGSMSEGDVNRSFFTDFETQLQLLQTKVGADGQISDEAIAPVLAQLDRFQSKVAESSKKKLDRIEKMYSGNEAYRQAVNELKQGGAFDVVKENIKEYEPQKEAGGMPSMDAIAAEMARRKAAQGGSK